MPVTLDLSDEVFARLRAEAARRGITLGEVVSELAAALPPEDNGEAGRKLGFVALGASTDERSAADVDEMLTEGFGRD